MELRGSNYHLEIFFVKMDGIKAPKSHDWARGNKIVALGEGAQKLK